LNGYTTLLLDAEVDIIEVEELDAGTGDYERDRGELAVVLQVQEIVADLLLGEPVRRCVEVIGQLSDGA
jgi:hypothetical protein